MTFMKMMMSELIKDMSCIVDKPYSIIVLSRGITLMKMIKCGFTLNCDKNNVYPKIYTHIYIYINIYTHIYIHILICLFEYIYPKYI